MTAQDIYLKIQQRVNKKDTSDFDNIPPFNIVEAFNKAQLSVVTRIYQQNNLYKSGFESTRKRVDDLRVLINEQPLRLAVTKYTGYYLTDKLPLDYLHYINSFTEASTATCKSKKLRNDQVEESNIHTLLRNETTKPSFLWGETLITLVNDKIKIYTGDEFKVNSLSLTYLKKPRNIDLEGYIKMDGALSTNIDPVLPEDVLEICVDEAVRIIQGDIQNQIGNQIAQQNLQMGE
jgi:hypothetical protein